MFQIYSRISIFIPFCSIIFFVGCKEENYPIPNVPVNITLNLDLPAYNNLNAPGGNVFIEGGSRGIVIYRDFDNFVALDRHSTYNSSDPCAIVIVNPDNIFELIDTCSGSRFSIINGGVLEGPAKFGLKNYTTSWNGSYLLSIYN